MLIEKINKLYDRKDKPKERNKFFVSETNKCPLAILYSFKKVPKPKIDPVVYRLFADGDDAPARLIKDFIKLRILVATEINIPDNDLFSGRADAIVTIDNELYVVEIKAVNNKKFERMTKPSPEQVKQLQLYLYSFNINKGIILIENKDNQQLREFVVERDDTLINQLIESFKKLWIEIESNQLPEKPKDLPQWKCTYCPYSEICKKNNMS